MSIRGLLLLAAPPVAGLVIGYLRGGRLAGLRALHPQALWLLWLAAAAQAAQAAVPALRQPATLVAVFGAVLAWLAVNLARWPAAVRVAGVVIALGALANGLAIAVNGRMPYDPAAAAAAGLRPGVRTPKNEPGDASTRLAVLGDAIPVAAARAVVSPGDLLIAGGTVALVTVAMRGPRRPVRPLSPPVIGGNP